MTKKTIAKTIAWKPFQRCARLAAVVAAAGLVSACGGGSYAAKDPVGPRPGPIQKYNPAWSSAWSVDRDLQLGQ